MAALHELIQKIENPELRAQIQETADRLTKQKKFGLVFEEHLPECTPLYDIPVRKGLKVSVRNGKANETYTVSFLSKEHRDDVIYLGTHSGRDGDKISQTSLTLAYTENGTPYFEEAFMVIECRKQYGAPFEASRLGEIPAGFYDRSRVTIHSAYAGQIMQILVNDDNR